jgi:hypothetical protein
MRLELGLEVEFCKMDIQPTFGMGKSVSPFSHPKIEVLSREGVLFLLQGNRETDFLEEYRSNVHFAKVQLQASS